MDNYRNSMSRENLIMLIMAGAILVFNLVGFIVSYFVWKDLSKEWSNHLISLGSLTDNLIAFLKEKINLTREISH